MTIQEQLKFGEDLFQKIDELARSKKTDEAYHLIDTTAPPTEWIIELDSKINIGKKYKTMEWSLMEAIAKRIFKATHIKSISSPVITQDRSGKIAVTVSTEYVTLMLSRETMMVYPGIATEVVGDISFLNIASPKAATSANKNAVKNIGGLFGKYLNKEQEPEIILPETYEPVISPEEKEKSLIESIGFAKSAADLKSFRLLVYAKGASPEIQSLYETKLRELTAKK